jgi:hypothetical protein
MGNIIATTQRKRRNIRNKFKLSHRQAKKHTIESPDDSMLLLQKQISQRQIKRALSKIDSVSVNNDSDKDKIDHYEFDNNITEIIKIKKSSHLLTTNQIIPT